MVNVSCRDDLLILADFLGDMEDPRESACRWMIAQQKWPRKYGTYWSWYGTPTSRIEGLEDVQDDEIEKIGNHRHWTNYPTLTEAIEAALEHLTFTKAGQEYTRSFP